MNDATRRLALSLKGPLGNQEVQANVEAKAVRLRKATESVLTLPTLPTVVTRILDLVDDPNASAGSLATVIGQDQVLTARLLKLANSAYYGYPRRIGTVNLAIVVLGFDTVRDLGLSVSVMEVFRNGPRSARFDAQKFWDHCVAVASICRFLARALRWTSAGETFTAGLLHDIGKVVLHQYHQAEFELAVQKARTEKIPSSQAEMEVLGASHAQVGGWLCEKWNLPAPICQAVFWHHQVDAAPDHGSLAALVGLSDHLVHRCGMGEASEEGDLVELPEAVFQLVSIEGAVVRPEDLEDLQERVKAELIRGADLRESWQ